MYHRIAEVELALWGLCVTPQHFAEQLEVLQQSNCFDLPRFGVDNWNGKEFAKQLSRWFYG